MVPTSPPEVVSVHCDVCSSNISGMWYRNIEQEDFDLCPSCFESQQIFLFVYSFLFFSFFFNVLLYIFSLFLSSFCISRFFLSSTAVCVS